MLPANREIALGGTMPLPSQLNFMRPLVFTGLGFGFMLMGAALFALTLRKPKPTPMNPTKSQLRERVTLAEENKKMRIAAGASAGFGAVLVLLTFV